MANFIIMPKLGLTMSEGKIIKWLKSEGDYVEEGDSLVEIETDKSSYEKTAKESGYLLKILFDEGDTVPILSNIAVIGQKGEEITDSVQNTATICKTSVEKLDKEEETEANKPFSVKEAETRNVRQAVSPLARKLAKELGVELSKVKVKEGKSRINAEDVQEYYDKQKKAATAQDDELIKEIPQVTAAEAYGEDGVKVPIESMRKTIAKKMSMSKSTIPHFYLSTDVDMTNMIKLREQYKAFISERYGVKLSYNDLLIKSAAIAMIDNPVINSYYAESEIIMKKSINISVAVAVENGIYVPVVKETQKKSLGEISRELNGLIDKARSGNLTVDEYTGGVMTISNLGMYDIKNFTAIINPPESSILAIGKIAKTVVPVGDAIGIRPIMNVTASFDHRVIDGASGALFLQRFRQLLENPEELLL